MEALLSVDLGTTGCKAALFTVEGRLLGASYLQVPLLNLQPGWVEQDAALWWSLSTQAIREAIAAAGIASERILALSVSSQGISFVPIDSEGRILRQAINWLDTRATAEAAEVCGRVGASELFSLTGKRPAPFYLLPKLLWLRRHEPALYERTFKFLFAHDFLLHRLCGAALTDYSLAGGSQLLDLHALSWSGPLLRLFEIDPRRLPGLAWAGTPAGALGRAAAAELGLRAGMPVVVGGQDQKCAALGAGLRPGQATVSLGTAAAISCLADRPVLDPERRIPTFPSVAPGRWVLEGVVGTAGAALRWLRDTLFPGRCYADLDRLAAASPPGAHGVRFYPHLSGAGSPWWQESVRGAFVGLSLAVGASDLVRSVLEGVAFEVRANLDVMAALAPVETLVLFGGGARSALWAQIIGAATGRSLRTAGLVDMANWGACLLAGVGAGLTPERLGADLRPDERVYDPDPALTARYDDLYRAYRAEDPARSG